jgi:hypothetical protein
MDVSIAVQLITLFDFLKNSTKNFTTNLEIFRIFIKI